MGVGVKSDNLGHLGGAQSTVAAPLQQEEPNKGAQTSVWMPHAPLVRCSGLRLRCLEAAENVSCMTQYK